MPERRWRNGPHSPRKLPVVRKVLRFALVFLAAIVMVAGLAWATGFSGPTPGKALSREEMLVGVLTLGVLAFAAFGFDLRDWF